MAYIFQAYTSEETPRLSPETVWVNEARRVIVGARHCRTCRLSCSYCTTDWLFMQLVFLQHLPLTACNLPQLAAAAQKGDKFWIAGPCTTQTNERFLEESVQSAKSSLPCALPCPLLCPGPRGMEEDAGKPALEALSRNLQE